MRGPLKSPIIAHRHLCLDMFESEGLISILKYGFKKHFDRIFLKDLMNNVV